MALRRKAHRGVARDPSPRPPIPRLSARPLYRVAGVVPTDPILEGLVVGYVAPQAGGYDAAMMREVAVRLDRVRGGADGRRANRRHQRRSWSHQASADRSTSLVAVGRYAAWMQSFAPIAAKPTELTASRIGAA